MGTSRCGWHGSGRLFRGHMVCTLGRRAEGWALELLHSSPFVRARPLDSRSQVEAQHRV